MPRCGGDTRSDDNVFVGAKVHQTGVASVSTAEICAYTSLTALSDFIEP